MIRQGAFSNKYMSNPLPSPFTKDKTKQNRNPNLNLHLNLNNTIQQNQCSSLVKSNQQNESSKTYRRSISTKRLMNNESKNKLVWEKHQKQLNQQIGRLKKQNQRLREDAKKAHKNNQQNIFSYQAYIKQVEGSRDDANRKLKVYEQQLKYCILWIVQTFSLAQNPDKQAILIEQKLNKSKMSQVIQKLTKTITQLQIQKYLQQTVTNHQQNQQSYLLYEKDTKVSKQNSQDHQHFQQFNALLDTFNLDKNSSIKEQEQHVDNIARRLFVNEDTFGHEIGEHQISSEQLGNEQLFSSQKAFIQSSCQSENRSGTTVKIKINQNIENDDYLKVSKGEEVKLLRKIGSLWIAQSGSNIGYISQNLFN